MKGPTHKISKYPKPTFYNATIKDARDKLAPNHYSQISLLDGYNKTFENNTGRYSKGKVKSNVD